MILAVRSKLSNCFLAGKQSFQCYYNIRTQELRDTGALPYHLNYEALRCFTCAQTSLISSASQGHRTPV